MEEGKNVWAKDQQEMGMKNHNGSLFWSDLQLVGMRNNNGSLFEMTLTVM